MKKKILLMLTYLLIILFSIYVTFATFSSEEYIIPEVYLAAITGLIYIIFTIGWTKLVQQTTFQTFHKWLFVVITWDTSLIIGDILFMQTTPIVSVMMAMLLCLLTCIYVYSANRMLLDGLMAGLLVVTLYIAMQFDHTIIPGGVIGGIVISMPFLIFATKRSLHVTLIVGRLVFFLMAFTVLFLAPATPVVEEGGYLLYLIIALFIAAFVLRNKIELLLPRQFMPVLLGITFVVYALKFF